VSGGALAECVINISEGRDPSIVDAVSRAGGRAVLDIHSDPEHHRSVLTLGGPLDAVEEAARLVVTSAVNLIDLRNHEGAHPRFGAADVVPFVPLPGSDHSSKSETSTEDGGLRPDVLAARNRFAQWAGSELALPCFYYGPERSLPEVRRLAFHPLEPDTGPPQPHPTAGASAVGARDLLVAYNVWLTAPQGGEPGREREEALSVARTLARQLRTPTRRSLGLPVGPGAQVSFNLIDPASARMADLYDAVATGATSRGCSVLRAELVGLVPAAVLHQVPSPRWAELDLDPDRTIEGLIEQAW
jgi:glutamate formiminotransferase / 5-formyltetrahydrofolate cyclo-ligase